MNIAVIPVRGGSRRIPDKNITMLLGKPLVSYTIQSAIESGIFDKVVVNTDDHRIADVGSAYDAEVYFRDRSLGQDNSFLVDVLKSMFRELNYNLDYNIGVLLATSPLRSLADLRNAYELYTARNAEKAVVSVCEYETPIQLAQTIDEKGYLKPVFCDDYRRSTRSTDHQDGYRFNGSIVLNTVDRFHVQNNLIGDSSIPYVMPRERSIDIDWPYQLKLVELLINKEA